MNTKTWIIFGVICVAVLGGLIAYSRSQNPAADTSGVDANSIVAASEANGDIADHVQGNENAKVVLIEYGDFQCPSCSGAHPGIKKITQEYGDKIAFVYRNFPLSSAHPNAVAAASAVEAAGLQDKYWQMHDLVFENQSAWSSLSADQRTNKFVEIATQTGIKDLKKFRDDLSAKSVSMKISFDQALGRGKKVTGTPAFFVNGEKVEDAANSIVKGDPEPMRQLLNSKLKENGVEPPAK